MLYLINKPQFNAKCTLLTINYRHKQFIQVSQLKILLFIEKGMQIMQMEHLYIVLPLSL